MGSSPLVHLVRMRKSDDFRFARPGLMDEVLVNANLLENSPQAAAAAIAEAVVPYSIDPVLARFQLPAWWRNAKGETKRNYSRLGRAYFAGTSVKVDAAPLLVTVASDGEWRAIARNVLGYQEISALGTASAT